MKTIGMLAGMSWESSVTYYEVANRVAAEKLGGLHSAKILMHSVDFGEVEPLMKKGEWSTIADILSAAAKGLQAAGAGLIIICTNTMHKLAPQIQSAIGVPLLHIADATADELCAHGINTVALLGTKTTMTEDFYKEKLKARGFKVLVPTDEEMNELDSIIFEELCKGIFLWRARKYLCLD